MLQLFKFTNPKKCLYSLDLGLVYYFICISALTVHIYVPIYCVFIITLF